MSESAIELRGIVKSYCKKQVLTGLDHLRNRITVPISPGAVTGP